MAQMPIHFKVKVKHIVASGNILHVENTLFEHIKHDCVNVRAEQKVEKWREGPKMLFFIINPVIQTHFGAQALKQSG